MDCINLRPLLNITRVYIHWLTSSQRVNLTRQRWKIDRTKVTKFDWNVMEAVGMDLLRRLRGSSHSYCTVGNFKYSERKDNISVASLLQDLEAPELW